MKLSLHSFGGKIMLRRTLVKAAASAPVVGMGMALTGCGTSAQHSSLLAQRVVQLPDELSLWSYYAPLLSYEGLFDEVENRHERDRLLDFEAVRRAQPRMTGRRGDGTLNRERLVVADLRDSEEDFVRVRFWHDDNSQTGDTGHTLFLFKRYLAKLEAGETLFVATGMIQSHFHVVMIEPDQFV